MLNTVWEMILDNKERYSLIERRRSKNNIIIYVYMDNIDESILDVRLQKGKPIYIEFNNVK